MVRFQWHVEDGLGASVGPGQLVYLRDHGVLQAMVEIEMPGGEGPLDACMNIPPNYNTDSGVKELGIVFAHGSDVSDWRGRLLTELAVSLARMGFLVMRHISHPSVTEARRVAMFEKVADVAATSPYARGVTRWVLAGQGGGARVAALAGHRVRSAVGGFVFMSYPLKEAPETPLPEDAGAQAAGVPAPFAASSPDSSGPLLGLTAPVLFVTASTDPLISETALVELGPRMSTPDVRSVVLPDVDSHFRTLTGKGPHATTLRAVSAALHEFLNGAHSYRMDYCKLPRIWRGSASLLAAVTGENDVSQAAKEKDRPQLQRPACFRPIPSGPPPQAQQPPVGVQAALPYGLTASAAQALAAQIQQRQAAGGIVAGAASGNAAQLLAQQMLLQQAAAAQRRTTDQADIGPASMAAKFAAASASRGSGGAQSQLAGLLSDPNAAAQIAAIILRNSAAVQQQQQQQLQVLQQPAPGVEGGHGAAGQAGRGTGAAVVPGSSAGTQALTVEALTSVLVQRLAQQQQQQQHSPQQQQHAGQQVPQASLVALQGGAASQLLAATLLNQQQQQQLQLQGASAGAAATAVALQQQQLQQLLLQQQQRQQQRQQQGLQSALLLQ
ncbi:hypothetical protein VaNZ11_010791, partial [Volvox africanus]